MDASISHSRPARRRALAALALTAATLASTAGSAQAQEPAQIDVEATLGDCSNRGPDRSCEIAIWFAPVAGAERYETVVSAPDGSRLATSPAPPGHSTISAEYRGSG